MAFHRWVLGLAAVNIALLLQAGTKAEVNTVAAHYVSPTGTASWAESTNKSRPCAPQTGMANAKAGETVYFCGGTYKIGQSKGSRGVLGPANSGTKDQPITFAACPGETPVILGRPTRRKTSKTNWQLMTFGMSNNHHNHIIFDGFTFKGDGGMCGLRFRGPDKSRTAGCVVRNCTFDGGTRVLQNTDNHEAIRIENTSHTLVRNCKILNFRQKNNWHNTSGIKMYHNDHVTIENCEILNCSAGIYNKSDGDNCVFRYNFVHGCHQAFCCQNFGWTNFSSECDRNCIHDNVLVKNEHAAINVVAEDGRWPHDWEIHDNTIYAEIRKHGIFCSCKRIRLWNNIVIGPREQPYSLRDDSILVESDHNQFGPEPIKACTRVWASENGNKCFRKLADWQSSGQLVGGMNPGRGSLASEPKFLNKTGKLETLDDFRLAPDSPCKGTGRNGDDIGADIDRVGLLP